MQASHRTRNRSITFVVSALCSVTAGVGNAPSAWSDDEKQGEVESRGMSQLQLPTHPGTLIRRCSDGWAGERVGTGWCFSCRSRLDHEDT